MRERDQTATFDPFGEPIAAEPGAASAADRRARIAAVAVFWTLATLLVAGRVYLDDQPFARVAETARTQIAALIGAN